MKIFLAGATGFVGERVLNDLLSAGHEVTALVHSAHSLEEIVRTNPNVKAVTGDVANAEAMLRAMPTGINAVIYLPGVLRESPRKGSTFQAVHVEGVRNVLAAAKAIGARRWIQMSALGARPNTSTQYYRTKWEAEELVRADDRSSSGLEWTILRPSLIFDDRPRRQHNFVDEIAKAIRMAPFVPILGSGTFLFQPVSADDVSQTIVQSLAKPETVGALYEIGGPEKLTYRKLILSIARAMGTKKPAIKIPLWAILPPARLLGHFSWFPISFDEILMLRNGNYVRDPEEDRKWRETFDLPLKGFSESVQGALVH
ncbi:MAG TPA: NAD(P)H-binding protein [Candidatus Kapabacteria bacterium]|nr:NAD(P)H-binding protein [Candidatus Kapabacteria bacterium]